MDNNKTRYLIFRLTPDERKTAEILARRAGFTSLSELLRDLIHREAERQGFAPIGLVTILEEQQLTQEPTN